MVKGIAHRTAPEERACSGPEHYIPFTIFKKEDAVMDVATITQLIGSLGFPVACVIAMFWFWNKEREDHKMEMQKMTEALNNNTLALVKIETVLDHGKS